ncbi:MAG: sulfatase-like hydrolase/transferase [Acetatifactor sp.]|nr:sulfatase-like hydrolase/transferase [Acetatifactor sp.]
MVKFSIIVVALNPGGKLKETIDSVLCQTFGDYEIVVKDGGSRDGSLKTLPEDSRIRLIEEPDGGIYEAMNQAVQRAEGEYLLFLNCGDMFYDREVLARAAACIDREKDDRLLVVYGDTYGAKNDVLISSPQRIDGFACYRNIPCHQSCFYEAELCKEKPYNPEYRIRADYDHFLWCYYQAKAKMVHMGGTVSSYEGGGYSESKENRRRDKEEHRCITAEYLSAGELLWYRVVMALTLAPVRGFLAENQVTSGIYHWLKECLYQHKMRILAGIVLLALELYFFLGTGILLTRQMNYLTGEGAWEQMLSEEQPEIRQKFVPAHGHLQSVSFLMRRLEDGNEGLVTLRICSSGGSVLYEKTMDVAETADGSFTDVEVNLDLSVLRSYDLVLSVQSFETGGYPAIGVCGKSYKLPENRTLIHGEKLPDAQLVARYCYTDALPLAEAAKCIGICLLTAFGIMFGLPRSRSVRRAAGIAFLTVGTFVLGRQLELLTYNEQMYLPIALWWNVGLMYVLELLVLLCTHSLRIAVPLTNLALTLLYTINYYVLTYRGIPFRVNDIRAAGTAAKVLSGYDFTPSGGLAVAWGICLLIMVFGVQSGAGGLKEKSREKDFRPKARISFSYAATAVLAVGIALGGGRLLLYTDFLNQVGFADEELRGIAQNQFNYFNGYLVGVCIDVKNSHISAPEGYSAGQAQEMLAQFGEAQPVEEGELPHVILIMNESFADLRVLGDLELSQENLPFFYSLRENTLRGYVNTPVYGGNTANSEFEVFSGCSMAFLPANCFPYQQIIRRPVNSLVGQMKQYGYTAYSMHPEDANNWNRRDVYMYYGFDESLWKEDFAGAERIHHGVSDAETYHKIMELYENREPGEKLFLFDLTIQNHGGYTEDEAPYAVTAEGLEEESLDEYLSLIKISDGAFQELVEYFAGQEEKVVICMFGDHHPVISYLVTDHLYGGEISWEQERNKYKTPFIIWANYDIEEADEYDISTNYLGGLLLKTAGIPLSPYQEFVEQMREEYPVITVSGYVDGEGVYRNWNSAGDEFPEYRMLQYYYLFDETAIKWRN